MKIHAVDVGGIVHAVEESRPNETLCGREHAADLTANRLPKLLGGEDLDRVECEECREAAQQQLEDPEFGY